MLGKMSTQESNTFTAMFRNTKEKKKCVSEMPLRSLKHNVKQGGCLQKGMERKIHEQTLQKMERNATEKIVDFTCRELINLLNQLQKKILVENLSNDGFVEKVASPSSVSDDEVNARDVCEDGREELCSV